MEYYYVHEEGDHLETCFHRRHCSRMFNIPTAAALLLPIEIVVSWMTSGDCGLLQYFSDRSGQAVHRQSSAIRWQREVGMWAKQQPMNVGEMVQE